MFQKEQNSKTVIQKEVKVLVTPDSATPWTVVHHAPLSMEFSRQEYWEPLPPPGDLPDPGMEPRSPALQADSFPSEPPGQTLTKRQLVTLKLKCGRVQEIEKALS